MVLFIANERNNHNSKMGN